MVLSSLPQHLCGGEAMTNVPFGAETRLQRNGILSRNKRLKLSDSSSSGAEQAWMQYSGATESHCGGATLDQMTGVESSHALTLHWGDTKQELSRLPCLTDSSPSSLPRPPPPPPPTEVIHLSSSLSVSVVFWSVSHSLSPFHSLSLLFDLFIWRHLLMLFILTLKMIYFMGSIPLNLISKISNIGIYHKTESKSHIKGSNWFRSISPLVWNTSESWTTNFVTFQIPCLWCHMLKHISSCCRL